MEPRFATGPLSHDRVARAGVCNRLAGGADMSAIVAAKTTGKDFVTDIVRIDAPVDFHGRKEIVCEDCQHFCDRLVDENFWYFPCCRK
jgi:hypothetical protein